MSTNPNPSVFGLHAEVAATHNPSDEEYGETPNPDSPNIAAVLHTADRTGTIVGATYRRRFYPLDTHDVCPNMPHVIVLRMLATQTVTMTETVIVDGPVSNVVTTKQVTLHEGALLAVIDCDTKHLAAWKATRTKRLAGRGNVGRLELDNRTPAAPTNPTYSAGAHRAHWSRWAKSHGFDNVADMADHYVATGDVWPVPSKSVAKDATRSLLLLAAS